MRGGGGGEGSGSSISPQILFSKTPETQLLSNPISLVLSGRQLHCKVVNSLLSLTFKNSLFIKPRNENET